MKIEETKRIVKQENLGHAFISTVRLTDAYKFDGKCTLGKYETMITYKGEWIDYQKRYNTLDEADIGHQEAILYIMKTYGSKGIGKSKKNC